MKIQFLPALAAIAAVSLAACSAQSSPKAGDKTGAQSAAKAAAKTSSKTKMSHPKIEKVTKTDAQWRAELSPAAYDVLRHEGTERAYSGALLNNHEHGVFKCAGCGYELFASDAKFESGTGWPSFFQPIKPGAVEEKTDVSFGMKRTAVDCPRCGGHLGHVFDDGPKPTGLRYCMNSVALKFEKK